MEPPEAASLPEEAEFVLEPPPCEGEALAEAALGAAAAEGAADVETEDAAVGDFGDALEGLLRPGGWRGAARRGVGLVADGYLALLARMDAAGEGAADALGLQREHHREIAVRVMRLLPLFLLTQVMVVFSLVYAVSDWRGARGKAGRLHRAMLPDTVAHLGAPFRRQGELLGARLGLFVRTCQVDAISWPIGDAAGLRLPPLP